MRRSQLSSEEPALVVPFLQALHSFLPANENLHAALVALPVWLPTVSAFHWDIFAANGTRHELRPTTHRQNHLTVTFCRYYSEVFGVVQIMEFLVGFNGWIPRVSGTDLNKARRAFLAARRVYGPTCVTLHPLFQDEIFV